MCSISERASQTTLQTLASYIPTLPDLLPPVPEVCDATSKLGNRAAPGQMGKDPGWASRFENRVPHGIHRSSNPYVLICPVKRASLGGIWWYTPLTQPF